MAIKNPSKVFEHNLVQPTGERTVNWTYNKTLNQTACQSHLARPTMTLDLDFYLVLHQIAQTDVLFPVPSF